MFAQNRSPRALIFFASLLVGFGTISRPAAAQYKVTNLVASQAGMAKYQDADLVNAWGLAHAPSGPICVAHTGAGSGDVL